MTDRIPLDHLTSDQLDALYDELDRLRAGEEDGYDPAAEPTPGQWIERWNRASPEMRLEVAKQAIENAGIASRCFMMAHQKRLGEDRHMWVAVARVRDVIADMEKITGARHWARILRKAIDGPGPEDTDTTPAELTAEEARALVDELGLDLYRAQDRLAFIAECLDAAEQGGSNAVEIKRVRLWLDGPKCGMQLAAENPGLYGKLTGLLSGPPPAPADTPDTITDPAWLREQYAAVIRRWWDADDGGAEEIAAAVLAVRDRRMEQLAAGRETWKRKAEEIEQERDQLATLLAVVLGEFRILPGTQTAAANVEAETVNRWRAVLDQTQEQP